MSNTLAIATVTATLANRLRSAASAAVGGADVTLGSPSGAGGKQKRPEVRLCLYHVAHNANLRNSELPVRAPDGSLSGQPRVALDLNYLIIFYGDEAALVPERMLGAVVRELHARPILSRSLVADAIAGRPELAGSNLGDSDEPVRLLPVELSLEQWSRLWSMFPEATHALSLVYRAGVVVIDAEAAPRGKPHVPAREARKDRGKGGGGEKV